MIRGLQSHPFLETAAAAAAAKSLQSCPILYDPIDLDKQLVSGFCVCMCVSVFISVSLLC